MPLIKPLRVTTTASLHQYIAAGSLRILKIQNWPFFQVKNSAALIGRLRNQFGFDWTFIAEGRSLLRSGQTKFLITEDPSREVDTVSDVALKVKNLKEVLSKIPPEDVIQSARVNGNGITSAIVKPPFCGDVQHTLIQGGNYYPWHSNYETENTISNDISDTETKVKSNPVDGINGNPDEIRGFELHDNVNDNDLSSGTKINNVNGLANNVNDVKAIRPLLTDSVDHITYVCESGQSQRILDWYEKCFGMKRFRIHSDESLDDGLVIGNDVGMRLKVGQWITEWMCDEIGAESGLFQLVLAEPLPGELGAKSHVRNFLLDHKGPGLQHIGLNCGPDSAIDKVVRIMSNNGAEFRKPPPTYYQLSDKRCQILDVLHQDEDSFKEFERLGLLVDVEADFSPDDEHRSDDRKALIQIFTRPLFNDSDDVDLDTFFLEILDRKGAKGFGAGNITALAQSIQLFQNKCTDSLQN